MKTVVFDLDGTLADTSGDLIAAANACFVAMGLGTLLDPARDAATALRGGRAMLTLGLSRVGRLTTELVDQQYPHLLNHYGRAIDTHTRLYPGAMDAVEALRRDGFAVAICTNKPEALAEDLMTKLGVRAAFGALIGADTLPVRKPDPEPLREAIRRAGGDARHGVLVGDTITDRKTAKAANLPSILVTFGPGDDDVRDLQPEGLISEFKELPGEVARLIG